MLGDPPLSKGSHVRLVGLNALASYNGSVGVVVETCNDGKLKIDVLSGDKSGIIKVNKRNCLPTPAPAPASAAREQQHHHTHDSPIRSADRGRSLSLSPSYHDGLQMHTASPGRPGAAAAALLSFGSPAYGAEAAAAAASRGAHEGDVSEFSRMLSDVAARDDTLSHKEECAALRKHNAELQHRLATMQGALRSCEQTTQAAAHLSTQGMQADYDSRLRTMLAKETLRIQEETTQKYNRVLEEERVSFERGKKQEWRRMQEAFDEQIKHLTKQHSQESAAAQAAAKVRGRSDAAAKVEGIRREFEALFARKVEDMEGRVAEAARARDEECGHLRREVQRLQDELCERDARHVRDLQHAEAQKGALAEQEAAKRSEHAKMLQAELSEARAENASLRVRLQFQAGGGVGSGGLGGAEDLLSSPHTQPQPSFGPLPSSPASAASSTRAGGKSAASYQPTDFFRTLNTTTGSAGGGGSGRPGTAAPTPTPPHTHTSTGCTRTLGAPGAHPGEWSFDLDQATPLEPMATGGADEKGQQQPKLMHSGAGAAPAAAAAAAAKPALATLYPGMAYRGTPVALHAHGVYEIKDLGLPAVASAKLSPGVQLAFHEVSGGTGAARTLKADAMLVSDFNAVGSSVRLQAMSE